MSFSNLQVTSGEMPEIEKVDLIPIHPDYLRSLKLMWVILLGTLLIILAIPVIFINELHSSLIISIAVLCYLIVSILTVTIGTGSFRRKSYAVREHDIIYKTGWIVQKLQVVPFNRIQHATVRVGPIDRRFGLASLTVFTAASMIDDVSIKGLPEEEAERIRQFIMEKIKPAG
jgi:membrane protein YdbS with pleckstrin-like domain